jgi:hypothetical protein
LFSGHGGNLTTKEQRNEAENMQHSTFNAGFDGVFNQIELPGFCEFAHRGKILTPANR